MKKLNEVLDGVMSDILHEDDTLMDRFKAEQAAHKAEYADGYGPADLPGGTTSGIYGYRYGQPGNPNGVPFGSEADGTGALDRLSAMWQGLSDGQKMAVLGGGIGGTALAAGAGALYLRRKQREANRARGL